MTDQPYTPTPDDLELFKKIAQLRYSNEQLRPEERQRAFDHFEHMLNAIESAAEQRGAIKALQDLADNHTVRIPDVLGYKVQAVFTETIWEKLDEMNRADQEGAQDG